MSDPANRQLFHDLRGVIAAAHANVDYLRERGLSSELDGVALEIAHELRLVADVIGQLGQRDPDRLVEVDLRALLWLAARSGARVRLDPTAPPFMVHGRASATGALVDAIVEAVAPGAPATLSIELGKIEHGKEVRSCAVSGLDARALDAVIAQAQPLGLSAEITGSTLVLRAAGH